MFFKSSNYSIIDHTVDPFEIILSTDTEIREIKITDEEDVYYSQDNNIYKLGKQKKIKSQDKISNIKIFNNLLVSGDISGNIKIFSNNILIRSYNEHSNKINGLELYDNKILISCSDDSTVKFYNILEQKSYKTFDWFNDRVRDIKIVKDILYISIMNGDIFGICLKTCNKIYEINIKEPAYKLEYYNNILYVTSFNKIYKIEDNHNNFNKIYKIVDKIEDNVNNTNKIEDKIEDSVNNTNKIEDKIKHIRNKIIKIGSHYKQITDFKIFNNKIYSISLDGFLKIWSIDGQLISKINFKSPILGFDYNNDILYFGLEIGKICRLGNIKIKPKIKEIKNKNLKDYEEEINYKIFEQEIQKNNKIEKLMKKYEHRGALKESLEGNNFKEIFSVLYYLQEKSKLKNAIFCLEKEYLINLLDFIIDNFHIRVLFDIFYDIIEIIILEFSLNLIEDLDLFERLIFLSDLVDEECLFQEKLIEVYSYLECFYNYIF